ncbi:MAG: DUF2505 domain-containing protein [Rhodococcus sp. (in: high G+C Gram-positive bacteria)]
MASTVDQRTTYGCSAAVLHATLTDAEYWQDRMAEIGNGSAVVDHVVDDGRVTSVVDQALEADRLPKALQRFAGSSMSARCTESWDTARDDGSATGTYTLRVTKMPVVIDGELELIPVGPQECVLRFVGTVVASVPIMGPVVEKVMVGEMDKSFEAEREFTTAWLASDRADRS